MTAEHEAIVRAILARHLPADAQVWVYGSRATGKARPMSDLDLALAGGEPIARSVLTDLAEDFDESDLPWKVDVIDWATTSEQFRAVISADRVVLVPGAAVARRSGITSHDVV